VVSRPDFSEGVRAVIIDKDNAPLWAPARLQDVDTVLLDGIFAPLPADQEWKPL
jgi:enoyl-CoA hydratase